MVYNCLRHILCFWAFTRAKSSTIDLTSIVRSNLLSILINVSMFRRPCPIVVRWAFFIRRSFENECSPVQFVTVRQKYIRSNISTFVKHDCMIFSQISRYMRNSTASPVVITSMASSVASDWEAMLVACRPMSVSSRAAQVRRTGWHPSHQQTIQPVLLTAQIVPPTTLTEHCAKSQIWRWSPHRLDFCL